MDGQVGRRHGCGMVIEPAQCPRDRCRFISVELVQQGNGEFLDSSGVGVVGARRCGQTDAWHRQARRAQADLQDAQRVSFVPVGTRELSAIFEDVTAGWGRRFMLVLVCQPHNRAALAG
ncbi:hypothetical protein WN71_035170 [Streptomyces mangrovisoli]|uniref:Uncharacterized protein n=1 Tax=Streptomyces mangrovisoli TaxID=1428628 RepID=A0A1J4NLI7_9ACTN|nr:hypothetical protein WN71_035170 [Streptomyces mangrovisoli]